MSWRILCESADLAVQCSALAQAIGLNATPTVENDPVAATTRALSTEGAVALVLLTPPELSVLVELADAARARDLPLVLALPASHPRRSLVLDVAADLGMTALDEIRPLMAALALLGCAAHDAHSASARALSPLDRQRLKPALSTSAKSSGLLVQADGLQIGWCASANAPVTSLGEARDVANALAALRDTQRAGPTMISSVDGVDPRVVLDVIFGPRRALSDPASKAALKPYDIPLPIEELCASPSRAAAEATRMGFPVRISLASPDLRVWDHPDLSVDMVDNAARVRDTFRQLMAAAEERIASATPQIAGAENRLLGVMVTATSDAVALLGVRATPLPRSRVAMEIGFADPHGRAANDITVAVLPADPRSIEHSLRRLLGSSLIFDTTAAQRKARLEAISDVLLRLAAFVHDRRDEIESVEVRPLALLLDGSAEVREACISVSDCFERSLASPSGTAHGGARSL